MSVQLSPPSFEEIREMFREAREEMRETSRETDRKYQEAAKLQNRTDKKISVSGSRIESNSIP